MLATLQREYDRTVEVRTKADARLTQLHAAITALTALATDEPPPPFKGSLADACRRVLRGNDGAMSPTAVRDGVISAGYPIAKHKNPMAAVHAVLKRLVESGDVETLTTHTETKGRVKDGTEYVWTGRATTTRAVATLTNPFQGVDLEQFQETYERLAQTVSQAAGALDTSALARIVVDVQAAAESVDTSALTKFAVDAQAVRERFAAVLPKVEKK